MGLDTVLRSALAVANTVTAPLQATVVHKACTGVAGYGKPTYGSAVSRSAVVEVAPAGQTWPLRQTAEGEAIVPVAHVAFLGPVVIAVGDQITLPDGTVTIVRAVGGVVDPTTGAPYAPDVWVS